MTGHNIKQDVKFEKFVKDHFVPSEISGNK